jgi:ubiquinone biosynthesis protein COQ9
MQDFNLKDELYNKTLEIIAFEGWNDRSIRKACKELNIDKAYSELFYPKGIKDIIDAFESSLDNMMLSKLAEMNLSTMRVRDKIFAAVQHRLYYAKRYEHQLRRLQGYYLIPTNLKQALSNSWNTADSIWYQIGDKSTDVNFYTKRTILMCVLKKTTTYWLNDQSDDKQETWRYLNSIIDRSVLIGSIKGAIKKLPFIRTF